jgi:hypothetical protein
MTQRMSSPLSPALGVLFAGMAMAQEVLPSSPTPSTSTADWREQYAYTLGVQAYLYRFPWVYMPQAIWDQTEARNTPPNQFTHFHDQKDASHQMGGAPNNDTLYSQT